MPAFKKTTKKKTKKKTEQNRTEQFALWYITGTGVQCANLASAVRKARCWDPKLLSKVEKQCH
jgi:hypothetical protein